MATASLSFLGFASIIAILYHLWANKIWRSLVLFAANIAFLASVSTDAAAYFPLAIFIGLGYAAMRLGPAFRSGKSFAVLLLVLVFAFCWLKKYWLLSPLGFIAMPYVTIGLSYIFFRVLHLVIDARDDPALRRIGFIAYVNYLLNFATLVAGPIQRFDAFSRPVPPLNLSIAGRAVERIAIGLFKVLIMSALFSFLQAGAIKGVERHDALIATSVAAAASVALYPLFLYFNFSGYTDIVIGIGRFLGMALPENFNHPFSALNFNDFWARYHMTLSNWLRDYVYTPLLKYLMERFPAPGLDPLLGSLALFVTFFLIGVWHGPTFMFVLYGILLAVGASANKLYQTILVKRLGRKQYRAIAAGPLYQALARGLTFTWYCLSMICFWETSDRAVALLRAVGVAGGLLSVLLLLLGSSLVLWALEGLRGAVLGMTWEIAPLVQSRYARTVRFASLVFFCSTIPILSQTPAPEIVYKAF